MQIIHRLKPITHLRTLLTTKYNSRVINQSSTIFRWAPKDTLLSAINGKSLCYKLSYSFNFCKPISNEEQQSQDHEQTTEQGRQTEEKNIKYYIDWYQKNKVEYTLRDKANAFRELAKHLNKQVLNSSQNILILNEIKSLLIQFNNELRRIPINGLLTGHRINIKKTIMTNLITLCYWQVVRFINKNQNLKSLIKNDRLAQILLENFQIFGVYEKFLVVKILKEYDFNLQYQQQLRDKIIEHQKKIDLTQGNEFQIINYFQEISEFQSKYFPSKSLITVEIIQRFAEQTILKKNLHKQEFMNLLYFFIQKYNVSLNKNQLLQCMKFYQKKLQKNIQKKSFKQISFVMKFIATKVNTQDEIDTQIREKLIKFLQFCISNGKNRAEQLIWPNLNHIADIMVKTNYFNLNLMKILDENLFQSKKRGFKNKILPYMEAKIQIYQLYEKNLNDAIIISQMQRQNLTYKQFIEEMFTFFHENNLLEFNQIFRLVEKCQKNPIKSEKVKNILREILQKKQQQIDIIKERKIIQEFISQI